MFRITCLVDDAKLARALHALNGLCYELDVVPVVNATPTPAGVQAVTSGTPLDMFREHLLDRSASEFSASFVRDFCISIGRKPSYYPHLINQAVEAKLIKKTGKGTGTRYIVCSR